mmetsp:Transcript_19200/g.26411  ORF Transcript_19200/g.26411 Transcript_19200/m.26411 type:complete len:115 (+) Transcript_19200:1629-1973(+)
MAQTAGAVARIKRRMRFPLRSEHSDILGGGSVVGTSKTMSQIRGLREKPPAGTYMGKHGVAAAVAHKPGTTITTNKGATSSSSVGSGTTSSASTMSHRSRNRPRSTSSAGFRPR